MKISLFTTQSLLTLALLWTITSSHAITFSLNADSTFQKVDGFGGALYFGESWL